MSTKNKLITTRILKSTLKSAFLFFTAALIILNNFSYSAAETREEVRKLYKVGVDYLNDANYEAAEAVFQKIIESGYDFVEAYNNLGYAKMKLKKKEEAIFELKNALKINPDYTDALNNLGLIYIDHPATASLGLSFIKKAADLEKTNPNYHDSLGLAYTVLGLSKEAEIEFKTANLLDKTKIAPLFDLGRLYELNNKDKAAIIEYEKVTSIKKEHLMANFRLFKIYCRQEDKDHSSYYLLNVFKSLKNPKNDKFERQEVENELLCNLKAFLVEMALNFNLELKKVIFNEKSGETSISANQYLIDYDEFSKNNFFTFFQSNELRCPESGKYYTNYVTHVTCPIHGSLFLFTQKIPLIKDVKQNYHAGICRENRKMIQYAALINDISQTEEIILKSSISLKNLIENGYLRDKPECPDGGSYEMDEDGYVKCSTHGKSN